MEFEILDWEAEVIRIARAFELDGLCRFMRHKDVLRLRQMDGRLWPRLLTGGEFKSRYDKDGYDFTINAGGVLLNKVHFLWGGSLMRTPIVSPMDNRIVRSLFHLDLLTTEVEAAFRVNLSAHEKLEWALEYEARYCL